MSKIGQRLGIEDIINGVKKKPAKKPTRSTIIDGCFGNPTKKPASGQEPSIKDIQVIMGEINKAAAEAFVNRVKEDGVTKETVNEYLAIAQERSASTKWLEANVWSKLDIETLKALQKAVEEQGKWIMDGSWGVKGISQCAYDLYFYISAREEKAENAKLHDQLPDKMKAYDINKDGQITEDEVEDVKAFVADLKSLSAEERTTVLKQTSSEFRLKLLEMLFEAKKPVNKKSLPKTPKIIPLNKNDADLEEYIKIIKEKLKKK